MSFASRMSGSKPSSTPCTGTTPEITLIILFKERLPALASCLSASNTCLFTLVTARMAALISPVTLGGESLAQAMRSVAVLSSN
eukprot:CAMPEP_0115139532 /NCGR_PEP_ID=MMETSP0227-20121206/58348_1 /TAXON_ID=89957 /ORGANISM="Polarella glacialis, Strain CCMP 1383" /LENGTH=83 /DNA_ID=CAMNT_0002547421 /DNA_START=44 /DNA_END=295 /DNA_ORIENTATION=+